MVICLEQGADLHIAQLMPLPLTVSCFSKIQIGFTLVPAHPGSPGKRAVKQVCVCPFLHCIALRNPASYNYILESTLHVCVLFVSCVKKLYGT